MIKLQNRFLKFLAADAPDSPHVVTQKIYRQIFALTGWHVFSEVVAFFLLLALLPSAMLILLAALITVPSGIILLGVFL